MEKENEIKEEKFNPCKDCRKIDTCADCCRGCVFSTGSYEEIN